MGDVHYMISEAAKHVGVESHVLRYWEEGLIFRSDALRWDIGTIRKKIYSFLAVSKNSKNRDYS